MKRSIFLIALLSLMTLITSSAWAYSEQVRHGSRHHGYVQKKYYPHHARYHHRPIYPKYKYGHKGHKSGMTVRLRG